MLAVPVAESNLTVSPAARKLTVRVAGITSEFKFGAAPGRIQVRCGPRKVSQAFRSPDRVVSDSESLSAHCRKFIVLTTSKARRLDHLPRKRGTVIIMARNPRARARPVRIKFPASAKFKSKAAPARPSERQAPPAGTVPVTRRDSRDSESVLNHRDVTRTDSDCGTVTTRSTACG